MISLRKDPQVSNPDLTKNQNGIVRKTPQGFIWDRRFDFNCARHDFLAAQIQGTRDDGVCPIRRDQIIRLDPFSFDRFNCYCFERLFHCPYRRALADLSLRMVQQIRIELSPHHHAQRRIPHRDRDHLLAQHIRDGTHFGLNDRLKRKRKLLQHLCRYCAAAGFITWQEFLLEHQHLSACLPQKKSGSGSRRSTADNDHINSLSHPLRFLMHTNNPYAKS